MTPPPPVAVAATGPSGRCFRFVGWPVAVLVGEGVYVGVAVSVASGVRVTVERATLDVTPCRVLCTGKLQPASRTNTMTIGRYLISALWAARTGSNRCVLRFWFVKFRWLCAGRYSSIGGCCRQCQYGYTRYALHPNGPLANRRGRLRPSPCRKIACCK